MVTAVQLLTFIISVIVVGLTKQIKHRDFLMFLKDLLTARAHTHTQK